MRHVIFDAAGRKQAAVSLARRETRAPRRRAVVAGSPGSWTVAMAANPPEPSPRARCKL